MTPEQRAQLEAMTGSDSPMAQAMAQMAGQQVGNPDIITLSISGMDPDSPHKMREQVLAIDVDLDDSDNAEGVTMPADVTYVIDASGGVMSQVLYVSDYGENDATVTFDKLNLQSGG